MTCKFCDAPIQKTCFGYVHADHFLFCAPKTSVTRATPKEAK